jgi:hypothetical protein
VELTRLEAQEADLDMADRGIAPNPEVSDVYDAIRDPRSAREAWRPGPTTI